MASLKNISLKDFRKFLKHVGCEHKRTKGGHEVYTKQGLLRPVIIQSHIDPIPIHIVKNNLRTLGLSIQDLEEFLK
ncbi:MAG: type II toxin-antitoxin system HicA family toxin [Bacteroidetes bacterium]|nr:type II toxin-antitoxin system HicA family toxin [Bacteroidota bacterium]